MIRAALDGLAWTFGVDPMMRKEFYGLSRRWQFYVFRALYAGLLLFVVWLTWMSTSNRARTAGELARFGYEMFMAFSVAQFFLAALAGIGAGADMISREVRDGTLGVLSLTPMSSWRIVLGKWKSCVARVLLLIVSTVPILGLGLYLGGVNAMDLARVACLTIATMCQCAAFAILCSTYVRNAFLSLTLGTLGMLAWALVPALIALIGDEIGLINDREVIEAAAWGWPMYALFFSEMMGVRGFAVSQWMWVSASLAAPFLGLLYLVLAARRTRRLAHIDPKPPLIKRLFEKLDRAFERASFGIKVWHDRTTVWEGNPLLWKELRSRITGRIRYFTRFLVLVIVVLGALFALLTNQLVNDEVVATGFGLLMVLIILAAIGSGSGTFTREKEERQWDILLTVPLRPGALVAAKFVGAGLGVTHFVLALLLYAAMMDFFPMFRSWGGEPLLSPLVISTLLFATFVVCVGGMISLFLSSTRKAYTLTLGVVLFLLIGVPILCGIFYSMNRYDRASEELFEATILATNPFPYIAFIEGLRGTRPDLIWGSLTVMGFLYGTGSAMSLFMSYQRVRQLTGHQG